MKSLSVKILVCTALCLILGISSGFSTISEIKSWYVYLNKPFWNPPNWLFGPAWTFLYLTMGIAVALIWHSKHTKKKTAITLFIVQFIFNLSWSFIFFNQHQIAWALVDISILLVLILVTIIAFYRINKIAAFLLIPYFLWVSFATCLNAAIWTLN